MRGSPIRRIALALLGAIVVYGSAGAVAPSPASARDPDEAPVVVGPDGELPPASGDVADAEATATGTWDNFNRTYTDHWGWTSSGVPWYTNVIHDWQGQYDICPGYGIRVDGTAGRLARISSENCQVPGHAIVEAYTGPWQQIDGWEFTAQVKPTTVDGAYVSFDIRPSPYDTLTNISFHFAPGGYAYMYSELAPMSWSPNTWYSIKWAAVWGSQQGLKVWPSDQQEPANWLLIDELPESSPTYIQDSYLRVNFSAPSATRPEVLFDNFSFGAPPILPVQPSCDDEDITRELGPLEAGDRVSVRFDPRFLIDRSLHDDAVADAIGRNLQSAAEDALDYYGSLGLPIPDTVTLEISCRIEWLQAPWFLNQVLTPQPPAFTGGAGHVQFRADYVKREFADAVRTGFDPGAWSAANADWRETIRHEAFHAIQWEVDNLMLRHLGNDHTFIESPAVMVADLFADTDDLDNTQYLGQLADFTTNDKRVFDVVDRDPDNAAEYQAAGALQYWAERFGPQDETNLERRAAGFLNALIRAPFQTTRWADGELAAFGATLGYDYSSSAYEDSDYGALNEGYARALDAMRDYYAAHFALQMDGVTPEIENRFVIQDANTGHGLPPGVPPGGGMADYPDLTTIPDLNVTAGPDQYDGQLEATEGEVLLVPVSATTVAVDFDVSAGPANDPDAKSALRLGYIPIENDGDAVLDPVMMPVGPQPGKSAPTRTLGTIGRSAIAVVVLAGNRSVEYSIAATPRTGTPALTISNPTSADPYEVTDAREPLVLDVRPNLDGVMPSSLDRAVFASVVGGLPASVTGLMRDGEGYQLTVDMPNGLNPGTYRIEVEYLGATATVVDGLVVDSAVPPRPAPVRMQRYLDFGQGESKDSEITINGAADAAVFQLQWEGSDFDLTLTAPSGRVITDSTVAGDVTVTRTATSIDLEVSDPEAGEWGVEISGVDVPQPEAVTLAASEVGTPVHQQLVVPDGVSAGDPLVLQTVVQGASSDSADAWAELRRPAGAVAVQLFDDGAHDDGGAGDGVFGASTWATPEAGTYDVAVTVTGVDVNGTSYERQALATLSVGPSVDTDGDGVSDAAEATFGTDSSDPSDGSVDRDGDGLGLAEELAAGSDPLSWDSDGGGENDASELAAGRSPARGGDDAAEAAPVVQATSIDGAEVVIEVSTTSGTGTVQLWRVGPGGSIAIGTYPGTGSTFTDAPPTAGEYQYRAVAVGANGAESAPTVIGPLRVADDVTAPDFVLLVNGGGWEAPAQDVAVLIDATTELPTEMRVSVDGDIANATWTTFATSSEVTLPAAEGQHFVYAQVRDAAGNESAVREAFVYLTDDTAPVSAASPLALTTRAASVDVAFTASDDLTGVASVELWWRHRSTVGSAWSAWAPGPTGSASPIAFDLASGPGEYEFYTLAVDGAGNREQAPAAADAYTIVPDDSPIWAWGSNTDLQLGSPTTASCSGYPCTTQPLQIRGFDGITQIVAGSLHSAALRDDGTVWTWGDNAQGQLGVGSGPDTLAPVQVPLSGVTAIAAGGYHTLALRSDGTVWAWGHQAGGLGDGTTTSPRTTPVQVSGLTNVVGIAAGRAHSLAVRGDGTVWAWGTNSNGQLGDNSTKNRASPVQVQIVSNITAVAAGGYFSLALKADGTVWAWGANSSGQLGIGSTQDKRRAVQTSGAASVAVLAAGESHSLAVREDGSLLAWGANSAGQVGNGSTVNALSPVAVAGVDSVTSLDGGVAHSVATTADGEVWGWGQGVRGQLDRGGTTPSLTPAIIASELGTVTLVTSGDYHVLALEEVP